jgi:Tol biopolymer transport system component
MGLGQLVRKVLLVAASVGALAPPLIATTADAAPSPTPPPTCVGTERLTHGSGNADAAWGGAMSGDGSFYVFVTQEPLVQWDPPLGLDWMNIFGATRGQPGYELINVDSGGDVITGVDSSQRPVITPDGRYVAFWAQPGLVVRDRVAGATDAVAVPAGVIGDLAVSADGRIVTFMTTAPVVAADGNNAIDTYAFDRSTRQFELVSVATSGALGTGVPYGDALSTPAVSGDGSKVAFATSASGLVSGDTNGITDVFVRDRAAATTRRVSVSASGAQLGQPSLDPDISADGSYVAFESASDSVVAGDANGFVDVFGVPLGHPSQVSLLSHTPTGAAASGSSGDPELDTDGSVVAFSSAANDLVPGSGSDGYPLVSDQPPLDAEDVFVLDRDLDLVTIASVDHIGQEDQSGHSIADPQLTADGAQVLFTTDAWLAEDDQADWSSDVYLRQVGAPTIQRGPRASTQPGGSVPLEITGSGFRAGLTISGGPGSTIVVESITNNVIDATLNASNTAPQETAGITVTDVDGCTASIVGGAYEVIDLTGTYTPLMPSRLLDTRAGGGPVGPGQTISLDVTGVGGVPAEVDSVAVNVTATDSTKGGYLTLFPGGTTRPTTSTINFEPGATLANLAMPKVGGDGALAIYNSIGDVHVIIDVLGYYAAASGPDGSRLESIGPTRVIDTRADEGGPLGDSEVLDLYVGVGYDAVVVNVTVTSPTTAGWITAWPGLTAVPNTSTVNFAAGRTVANAAVIPVGSDGWVSFYHRGGSTHLVVDLMGMFVDSAFASQRFTGLAPARVLDTRSGGGAPVPHGGTYHLTVAGVGGIPADAATVVVNVTGVRLSGTGWVTAYPSGTPVPDTSNLNLTSGQVAANLVIVPVGADGAIELSNQGGPTHLIVDVVGYFR